MSGLRRSEGPLGWPGLATLYGGFLAGVVAVTWTAFELVADGQRP